MIEIKQGDDPASRASSDQSLDQAAASLPVGSVAKANMVLSAFGAGGPVLGVSELSRRTGLAKSTTHRVLSALASVGLVERSASGYRLSRRLGDLADHAASWYPSQLREQVLPSLLDLYEQTHHTVRLTELRGTYLICLENLHRHRHKHGALRVGDALLAERSAAGRLLLAYADESVKAQTLSDRSRGRASDQQTLRSELNWIRKNNCAIDRGRLEPGVASVAVPVHAGRNRVFAAILLSGAEPEFDTRSALRLLRMAASGISGTLSSAVPQPGGLQAVR
jgi:IclR family KDG regulon transcriptional repressor